MTSDLSTLGSADTLKDILDILRKSVDTNCGMVLDAGECRILLHGLSQVKQAGFDFWSLSPKKITGSFLNSEEDYVKSRQDLRKSILAMGSFDVRKEDYNES
jgi:hypothetical protein